MEAMEKLEPHESERADAGVETVLDDIIDLEEYAKLGKRPAPGERVPLQDQRQVIRRPRRDADRGGGADAGRLAASEGVHASRQVRRRAAA